MPKKRKPTGTVLNPYTEYGPDKVERIAEIYLDNESKPYKAADSDAMEVEFPRVSGNMLAGWWANNVHGFKKIVRTVARARAKARALDPTARTLDAIRHINETLKGYEDWHKVAVEARDVAEATKLSREIRFLRTQIRDHERHLVFLENPPDSELVQVAVMEAINRLLSSANDAQKEAIREAATKAGLLRRRE